MKLVEHPLSSAVVSYCRSNVVPLFQFVFFLASMVSYVAFVLSLFIPDLLFVWCPGKDVLRNIDISWVFSVVVCSTLRTLAYSNTVDSRYLDLTYL